jgi:hypothetical protein
MPSSIEHQDAAGTSGASLGAFNGSGSLVALIPDDQADEYRARGYEVLLVCPAHPGTSAVDCLVCVPED